MSDPLTQFLETAQAISADYGQIQRDLADIKRLLGRPAYVVCVDHPDRAVADSLIKKIAGPHRPGEIICLNREEFQLYQDMLPCPPRSP